MKKFLRFALIALSGFIVIFLGMTVYLFLTLPGEKLTNFSPNSNPSRDIFIDEADYQNFILFRESFGGITGGVFATYQEQFKKRVASFHVDQGKPFIGESFFWNGTGKAKEFAVSCLLDYVQVPCQPGDQAARITILEHNQELRLPVQISLEDGRHDLSFLIVADPFEDMQINQPDRADTNAILNTYNIFTNNSIQKPRYPVLQTTLQYKLPWVSPFIVSEQNQDLMNANGSMEVWLDGKGGPGEMLEFYLHFGLERIDLIPNHEMVVMAFLDYEQIPIYVEDNPFLPLVVKHSPLLWESQRAQIKLPEEPGNYILFFYAQPNPFFRNEVRGFTRSNAFGEKSQRILIQVE